MGLAAHPFGFFHSLWHSSTEGNYPLYYILTHGPFSQRIFPFALRAKLWVKLCSPRGNFTAVLSSLTPAELQGWCLGLVSCPPQELRLIWDSAVWKATADQSYPSWKVRISS